MILELFHGPTASFKDFGARFLAALLGIAAVHTGEKIVVLVATSGDTGGAVADGFAGTPGVEVVILYPGGQVSTLQEKQLTMARKGITACRVEGTFDDCQHLVKAAFRNALPDGLRFSTANSINVGRLLPQSVYYHWAASRLNGAPVFCVPSGNLGNLTAGVLAAQAGLRHSGFIAAHNANDRFPRFLAGNPPGTTPTASIRTISNAMDVGVPSNLERLIKLLPPRELRGLVKGSSISDGDTVQAMRDVFKQTGYVADPHTAVALEAVRKLGIRSTAAAPTVILSTAHPAKFPDTVEQATGRLPDLPESMIQLETAELRSVRLDNQTGALMEVVRGL